MCILQILSGDESFYDPVFRNTAGDTRPVNEHTLGEPTDTPKTTSMDHTKWTLWTIPATRM